MTISKHATFIPNTEFFGRRMCLAKTLVAFLVIYLNKVFLGQTCKIYKKLLDNLNSLK